MRVALDAAILRAPRTGIGHYVAALSAALAARDDIDLQLFDGLRWRDTVPDSPLPGSLFSSLFNYARASGLARQLPGAYALRRFGQQLAFSAGARRLRPDVYHEPSLWPLAFDGPMLMTLHDLTHLRYPQTQPAARLREIERRLPAALARASRILFDSRFIADEARAHYAIAPEKIVVAPLGVAAHFHPRSDDQLLPLLRRFDLTPRRYLLCVGTLEPRKNLPLALKSYLALPAETRQRYPLLIVGMTGWRDEQLQPQLARAVAGGQVRLAGYCDDATLAALLAGARLLLFPSLYEGFGLPVLEAMASGTPVLLSRCSALPETAGDAGHYFEPEDVADCTRGLLRLIDDDAHWSALRDAGLQRAQRFSWAECARITADAYRQASDTHRRASAG